MKTRKEKLNLIHDLESGKRSIHELRATRFYILDQGILTNFAGRRLSVDDLCNRFIPGKDILLPVGYTAGNLPAKFNYCDPSGAVLQEIINRIPELDDSGAKEFIEDAKDLRETKFYKSIKQYEQRAKNTVTQNPGSG